MTNIIFFNHFHNGDLHISREFIRKIMQKMQILSPDTTFSYAHVNDPCLLSDIPNLGYQNLGALGIDQFENLRKSGDTYFINTWYAQQHYRFMNVHGMTLDCLYEAFDDTCKTLWNFPLNEISNDPSSFIPTIDYSKYHIKYIDEWLANNPQKKIIVSNGAAMSGQATNFLLTPIICELAAIHTDKIFILTNQEGNFHLPSNVIYSRFIINKPGNDLNENAYLSEHCDVIIGRASGVFSYAWTQNNMIKRKSKFVCFCGPGVVVRPPHKFWLSSLLSDKINYSAEYIVSHTTDSNEVKRIIHEAIIQP